MLYQKLTRYLLPHLPKNYQRNFYSWIEQGQLINSGRDLTQEGGVLAIMQTQCIFWFEELPFREINPKKIMALIQIWLNENINCDVFDDPNNEVDFELVLIDDNTADLQFRLVFNDKITLHRNDEGDLNLHGLTYSLDDVEIWTAEHFSLEARVRYKEKWQKQD